MRSILFLIFTLLLSSCSDITPPKQRLSNEESKDTIYRRANGHESKLSVQFASELKRIVSKHPEPWTKGKLKVAPRGHIKINDKTYEYYGFLAKDGYSWGDPVLQEFWLFLNKNPEMKVAQFIPK